MSKLRILYNYRLRSLLNLFNQQIQENKLKFIIISGSAMVVWFVIFMFFHWAFIYLHNFQEIGDMVAIYFLALFFFALGIMLTISNAIINYSSLFRSQETDFLLVLPMPVNQIFAYKITESLLFSSWAFLFLGSPLLIAYGIDKSAHWHYYLWIIFFSGVFVIFPALLGSFFSLVVARFFPRHRKYILIALIIAIIIAGILILARLMPLGTSKAAFTASWMQSFLADLSFAQNPLLPSAWVMRGITSAATDNAETVFFFLLLLSNGLLIGMIVYGAAKSFYLTGYSLVRSDQRERRIKRVSFADTLFLKLLGFLRLPLRLIIIKDIKTLIRDPVQWSQLLIFFGLLAIYFINIRNIPYIRLNETLWQYLVSSLNLIATTLTLATFTTRFVYPQISLEGKRFWIIGMMPISRQDIFYSKFLFSFLGAIVITEPLIFISSYQLGIPYQMVVLQLYLTFIICVGLSALSVTLGVFYPNLREDNPSKIVSGFGGTLTLVFSLLYVLSIVIIGSLPGHLYYVLMRINAAMFNRLQMICVVATLVIAVVTVAVSLSLGIKAIQKMEV